MGQSVLTHTPSLIPSRGILPCLRAVRHMATLRSSLEVLAAPYLLLIMGRTFMNSLLFKQLPLHALNIRTEGIDRAVVYLYLSCKNRFKVWCAMASVVVLT